ncbi:MAG TPA: response regulator [Phycisphaerae bacterium]|nr:response regulator [Phycisphaerae bacterium]HUT60926.1 response regulator [Phycisphaerae bacterium]
MAKRILVVDDDSDVRQSMDMVLSGAGYEVLHADSRRQAEQKLQAEKVDLIILDVMMETDTEGFHLAHQIRADEKLKDIPIIILTCIEAKTGETIDATNSGDYLPVQGFLRKPLDPDELKARVAELVG